MKITKKQLQEMVRKEAKRQLKEQNQEDVKMGKFLEYAHLLKNEADDVAGSAQSIYEMAIDVQEMEGPGAVRNWNEDIETAVKNLQQSAEDLLATFRSLGIG